MPDPAATPGGAGYPPVLKLGEVATLLRLTDQATSRLIRVKRLPGFRVGGSWRILWSQLQEVMSGRWPPPPESAATDAGPVAEEVLPELAGYPTVMKLDEVATFLRVNRQVAGRLLHHGQLPGFRAGGEWRLCRDQVQDLVTGRWTPPALSSPPSSRPGT